MWVRISFQKISLYIDFSPNLMRCRRRCRLMSGLLDSPPGAPLWFALSFLGTDPGVYSMHRSVRPASDGLRFDTNVPRFWTPTRIQPPWDAAAAVMSKTLSLRVRAGWGGTDATTNGHLCFTVHHFILTLKYSLWRGIIPFSFEEYLWPPFT